MEKQITVVVNGKRIVSKKEALISDIIDIDKHCGGMGSCGKCRVYVKGFVSAPCREELNHLTKNELNDGIRLACHTKVLGDCVVEYKNDNDLSDVYFEEDFLKCHLSPSFKKYGVAIDIGTTTIAAVLYDIFGHVLCKKSILNPQTKFGADVITRIDAALSGKEQQLFSSVRDAVDEIVFSLSESANIQSGQIDGVVVTGNTVMLSILGKKSLEGFSKAPFFADSLFGCELFAGDLNLSSLGENTKIYVPCCISPFVGADLTCALLATNLCDFENALLCDIGTNGEIALWHSGKLYVCSTAAGPAFEGAGITMGMRAHKGAVEKISLIDNKLCVKVVGDVLPTGICSSGLVDAISCMLDIGVLDYSGYLKDDVFYICDNVFVNQKDIRAFQVAKSAISAGIITLCKSCGIEKQNVGTVYVAGGLGHNLNLENAIKTGLLPEAFFKDCQCVGNASLMGASKLLLNVELRQKMSEISKNAQLLDLSQSNDFSEMFMTCMSFEKVDI